jgi:hypothetical protein
MIGQALPFGGLEFTIPLVLVALIVFVIVALVTARRDPDPAGQRPYAIYLVLIVFIGLFVALFSAAAVASNMVQIPLSEQASGFAQVATPVSAGAPSVAPLVPLTSDADNEHIRGAVQAGLILVAALAILWFHVGRLRELVEPAAFRFSPGRRTYQVYLHAVTFVAMVILLFATAAALYGVARIIAPGTTGPSGGSSTFERDAGITQAVTAGILALGAYAIAWYHWMRTRTLQEKISRPPRPGEPPPPPPV